jgi:hypothetical protein
MPDYRTPEEERAQDEQAARIRRVLDQATRDGGSLFVAIHLGEPQDVIERWTNRVWDGLRRGLSDNHPQREDCPMLVPDEDRLAAIVLLLEPRAKTVADQVIAGMTDA